MRSRLKSAYPGGVRLVELSPLHACGMQGPEVVGLATMAALGVADQTTRPGPVPS
ncbi:hypothetical protein OHA79_10565 [Streptomyces sp. NBC_00841]|uniref:hypothetical protein n=1 Tax=unclassified Streptomyces TaxID=2593676 RepID=UPI00225851B4|nr:MULTISPECIES: hypothetical protein [unclassified Streptomyces]MCX4536534.1 hypothetical protein [Streptomyces sp. NBC_01669]WRZ98235.1 hypothetical protein OHA79_10565 [Streptomyces sp. NBC_00841]